MFFSFYLDACIVLFVFEAKNHSSFDHEMHVFSIVHFEHEMRTRAKHSNTPSFDRS